MVRTRQKLHKFAFTMIELIFAIVVIAITVMSLPMLARVTAAGIEKNLVQEAIFASVAEINLATAAAWDDASWLDENQSDYSRVINENAECVASGSDFKRAGHVSRQCLSDNSIVVDEGDNTDFYIISMQASAHDWNTTYEIADTGTTGLFDAAGYKTEYSSKLDVNWCGNGTCDEQFGTIANDNNIKEVVVTIRNGDGKIVTLLRTYNTNIGEVQYASRFIP